MVGRVNANFFGIDPGSTGDGYFWKLGEHTSPGTFEHEITFDHLVHSGITPGGRGEWPWGSGAGSYLNSILFESKSDGSSLLGPQLMDVGEFSSTTVGTLAGPGPANAIIGQTIIWNTWEIVGSSRVIFHNQHIDDVAHAGAPGAATVYMFDVMDTNLVVGEYYEVTLTISDMTFQGGGSMSMGVALVGGVSTAVRVSHNTATQATGSDPWNGLGGRVTETFQANSADKINLFAHRSVTVGGISSTAGPSGDMYVSIKQVVTNGFGGTISNVSVEELDETVARVEIKVDLSLIHI